jgi:hypothetical protein
MGELWNVRTSNSHFRNRGPRRGLCFCAFACEMRGDGRHAARHPLVHGHTTRHQRIAQRFRISVVQQYGREVPDVLRAWAVELEELWEEGSDLPQLDLKPTGAKARPRYHLQTGAKYRRYRDINPEPMVSTSAHWFVLFCSSHNPVTQAHKLRRGSRRLRRRTVQGLTLPRAERSAVQQVRGRRHLARRAYPQLAGGSPRWHCRVPCAAREPGGDQPRP